MNALHSTRGVEVPVLSRFYGIVVYMNYRDHEPSHFHARYQDQEELERNWAHAGEHEPLDPIGPLS